MYKKIYLILIVVVLSNLFSINTITAQKKKCKQACMAMNKEDSTINTMTCEKIPNLTKEQQQTIKESKIKLGKELLPLQNQLREKNAHLITLSTADPVDINSVNTTIDEITGLRAQIMKKRVANGIEIRKNLTDEQKMMFMKQCGKQKKCCKKGMM